MGFCILSIFDEYSLVQMEKKLTKYGAYATLEELGFEESGVTEDGNSFIYVNPKEPLVSCAEIESKGLLLNYSLDFSFSEFDESQSLIADMKNKMDCLFSVQQLLELQGYLPSETKFKEEEGHIFDNGIVLTYTGIEIKSKSQLENIILASRNSRTPILEPIQEREFEKVESYENYSSFLSARIDRVTDLDNRTANCLLATNIKYIGDLIQIEECELVQIPNLGVKSMNRLKEELEKLGVSLGENIEKYRSK